MTPDEVGEMTLDQIFMRLADKRVLRKEWGRRVTPIQSAEAKPDKDGMVRGRAADGTPIKGKVGGVSYAAQVAARYAAEAVQGKSPTTAADADTGDETPRQRRARRRAERRARRGGVTSD